MAATKITTEQMRSMTGVQIAEAVEAKQVEKRVAADFLLERNIAKLHRQRAKASS